MCIAYLEKTSRTWKQVVQKNKFNDITFIDKKLLSKT